MRDDLTRAFEASIWEEAGGFHSAYAIELTIQAPQRTLALTLIFTRSWSHDAPWQRGTYRFSEVSDFSLENPGAEGEAPSPAQVFPRSCLLESFDVEDRLDGLPGARFVLRGAYAWTATWNATGLRYDAEGYADPP